MKAVRGLIGIICGVAISSSVYAATGDPTHAFKHSYDQLLEELPHVRDQLTETDVQGMKRWSGTVPVGSAASIVQVSGKDKSSITGLTVILISTPSTSNTDYDSAEALRDVLFQGLLGKGDAFKLVDDFYVAELARQQPIIKAGGKPKRGVKKIAEGTSQVSLELVQAPQGFMAIYSVKLL